MMQQSPVRQPLHERSANTFITITNHPVAATKPSIGVKRRIDNVDSPGKPPSPLRPRATQESPREFQQGSSVMAGQVAPPIPAIGVPQSMRIREDIEEGDSQGTVKDSTISLSDTDPLDDTMLSQQTALTEVSQPDRSAASVRAELLRLRLRVAMFKIRTGQTSLPMSLCVPPGTPSLPVSTPPISSQKTTTVPRLLPAPLLQPTAYSARMTEATQIPSSPPSQHFLSPVQHVQTDNRSSAVFRTPALPKPKQSVINNHQLSSPLDSQQHVRTNQDSDLTSSAIRGNAARDLLDLMQSR